MPHAAEIFYLVFAAHIPSNMVRMLYHERRNSGCPRAATNDGDTSTLAFRHTPDFRRERPTPYPS